MSTAPHSFNHNDLPQPFRSSGSSQPRRGNVDRGEPDGVMRKFAPWMGVLAMCCVVAISISGYLAWAALTSSKIAGCGSSSVFNCSHVTNSKWSTLAGIPVSILAIGSYLSLATALAFAIFQPSISVKRFAWSAVLTFALSAGLAALWFTGLQMFVLQHYCQYCLIAHGCGVIAAVVAVWKIPNSLGLLKVAAPLAVSGIAVLVVGQILQAEPQKFRIETYEAAPAAIETFDAPFAAPTEDTQSNVFEAPVASSIRSKLNTTFAHWISPQNVSTFVGRAMAMMAITSPVQSGNANQGSATKEASDDAITTKSAEPAKPAKRRTVGLSGGAIKLDVTQWPLNGSVDAKHIFVEMLDYNCPNCRKTHKAVSGAKRILENDVAVIILPIPLNTNCNSAVTTTDPKFIESCDIAKLAIAVWRIDPAAFGQFHETMFADDAPKTLTEATTLAQSMVDPGKLQSELASGIPGKYIRSMVQLYERTGKGGVPKLMFPGTSIVGEFSSAQSLADVILEQTK